MQPLLDGRCRRSAVLLAGELPQDVQERVTNSKAWTDQLKSLLDVLRRMGLLSTVLRTQRAAGPRLYFISRTAIQQHPLSGADHS